MPANFYIALVQNTNAPTINTNTFGPLDEIAAGNGYTSGGIIINTDSTDWDTLTQNPATSRSFVQLKNYVWTASAGPIPSSGAGARYLVILDNAAVVANREVYYFQTLTTDRTVSDGQTLTLTNVEVGINTA